MHDSVPKGTGNSRFLKSVSDFMEKYPTYQDFAAALVAGTMPVDIGLNADGWLVLGMALAKMNLLRDETATELGIDNPADATVDDAFKGVMGYFHRYSESTFQKLVTGRLV